MNNLIRMVLVFGMIFILIVSGISSFVMRPEKSDVNPTTVNMRLDERDNNENSEVPSDDNNKQDTEKDSENENDNSRGVASVSFGRLNKVDLDDITATFEQLFSKLDPEVTIYPSENYLYFRFNTDDKQIWGNIRLSPEDRDSGFLHFAYYEFKEDLVGPEDANIRHKLFGPDDGLTIIKLNDFCYAAELNGKRVQFNLHQLDQAPPKLFKLTPSEDFVFETYDESGLQFFLIFNKNTKDFYYILNEEESPLEEIQTVSENVIIDKRSKFGFFEDGQNQDRKILFGVFGDNVMQNNYFDGPFDQLADNYVDEDSKLSGYIEQAYPYTKGLIDEYGNFLNDDGYRVAIMPYYIYKSEYELYEVVETAKNNFVGDKFYSKITTDYQKSLSDGLEFNLMETELVLQNEIFLDMDNTEVEVTELEDDYKPFSAGSSRCGNYSWWHKTNVTYSSWHTKNVTWSKHNITATLLKYHIKNVTWFKHNLTATWSKYHIKNVTWWCHKKNITYPYWHIKNVTWKWHNISATWSKYHIKNVTWRPHLKCITYPFWHIKNVTWRKHNITATWSKYHIKNVTWYGHKKNVTYPCWHVRNVTWSKHNITATWQKYHIRNVTWSCHKKDVTYPGWHVKNVTWPRHTRNVTWSKVHVRCVTWKPHVKSVTYPYWHIKTITWPKHTRNVTWSSYHIKKITWIKHIKCITWSHHKRCISWSDIMKKYFKYYHFRKWYNISFSPGNCQCPNSSSSSDLNSLMMNNNKMEKLDRLQYMEKL